MAKSQLESPPLSFPTWPLRGRRPDTPLRLYRTPSCSVCPERAKPCHTLLRGDATGGRRPAGRAGIARGRREDAQRCFQWCALEGMAIKYRLKYLYTGAHRTVAHAPATDHAGRSGRAFAREPGAAACHLVAGLQPDATTRSFRAGPGPASHGDVDGRPISDRRPDFCVSRI
jgi:hypothetical protein